MILLTAITHITLLSLLACTLLVVVSVDARLLLSRRSSPTTISGLARIIDGDTLELPNKQVVRLFGIDAPESNQCCTRSSSTSTAYYTCGISSKTSLSNKIGAQPVTCTTTGKPDKYGRTIGTCKNSKGVELNSWLVSRGWAVAYYGTKASNYTKQEQQAAARKVGMWGGGFQRPFEFRKSPLPGSKTVGGKCPLSSSPPSTTPKPSPSPSSPSPPSSPGVPDCPDPIKGNINSKKEKIYHTVNSPSYKITTIEVEKGERWFCTEAEAIKAGWRAAAGGGGGSTPPPPGDGNNNNTPSPPPDPPSPPPPTSYTEEPNCQDPIKGNINSKKEKIYHTVKSPYYKATTIEPEKGERWFCNEADAITFGWRAPG